MTRLILSNFDYPKWIGRLEIRKAKAKGKKGEVGQINGKTAAQNAVEVFAWVWKKVRCSEGPT